MKTIYILLLATVILTSCGEKEKVSKDLLSLNIEKQALKKQLDSLSLILKSVEDKISKLDTLKKLAVVTTIKSTSQDFNHYIEVHGTVKADKSVELHSEMGGTITKIYAKGGQYVKKGAVLAQFDTSIINSNIAQVKTQLNLATTSFERQARLWKQKIGSEMQYLQAKAQKENLENNIKVLQAQARKMKIIAPFAGTVDQVFAKIGQLASPQMPILRIVNLDSVYLESEVTESYLKEIKKGTNVLVSFPSLDKEISSRISQVGNFINPNNRSFKTRINIRNKSKKIKANQLADIKINDFKANGIVIPSKVIKKDSEGNHFVYTIVKEDSITKVFKSLITVAKEYDNQSYISKGLTEGALVVDKGSSLIKNEEEVIIANK